VIAKIITSRDKAGKEHYGAGMRGLIAYLVGPGKVNEHTDPHLVASSGTLAVEYAGTGWDADKTGSLARVVDGAWRQARRAAGLPLTTAQDGQHPAARGAAQGEHVFHAVLSLRADEGQLSDEQWGRIAADYMDAMGFTAASGRAECQWVAVRHGLSAEGNDHLHLAACMVREDGNPLVGLAVQEAVPGVGRRDRGAVRAAGGEGPPGRPRDARVHRGGAGPGRA
jgi:hypothetical protein